MKKYILLLLLSIALFSCKNETQSKSNSESKSDTNIIGYDTSVLVARNFKPIKNKNEVLGVWACYMDGSRLPYNLTIHEDGSLDYDDRKGSWEITNGQLSFSDNLNNYTGRIDGKYLRLKGVTKLDGRNFETEVIKMTREDIEKEKRKELVSSGDDFFINHTFNSGNANQISFTDNKTVISLERYYNGSNKFYLIEGSYEIYSDNSIKIKWKESNTISFLNTRGATCGGLQTVRQSYIFSDIIIFDNSNKSLNMNCTFKQSFYEGTRCGNEEKQEDNYDGFIFTLSN